MCKAVVVYEEKLGKRRCGWCCYLPKSRDFTFWSDKQVKEKISAGELVNGLCVSPAGEVGMDKTFTTALLAKTGLATFTPISEDSGEVILNKYYAVVGYEKDSGKYSLVTNRCGVEVMDESRLKALMELIPVGGATLKQGKIVLHPAVAVEDATAPAPAPTPTPDKGRSK